MPLPNTSPDMSPTPITVNGVRSGCRDPSSRKWRFTASQAPLRGDAHALVVIALRAARGEGVAEPEPVLLRHAVGDNRRRWPCPCRRRPPDRDRPRHGGSTFWRRNGSRRRLDVVGHVEQARDEECGSRRCASAMDLVPRCRPRGGAWAETALGAHRHDHRVLDLLRLHQAQHLGAEILLAVRPAQPAPGNRAVAQMHAFDPRSE